MSQGGGEDDHFVVVDNPQFGRAGRFVPGDGVLETEPDKWGKIGAGGVPHVPGTECVHRPVCWAFASHQYQTVRCIRDIPIVVTDGVIVESHCC